jgi:sugar-specific transcriptional regulator TrmB
MKTQELTETLEELNLSNKEANIYLTLLELGQSNVTRLSHKSKINRITTYHILSSLSNKGLVTSITKDKIQNFQAVDPKRLIKILKEKQEKIESILPELENLKKSVGKRPSVELFEGPKGISTLLDDTLNTKNEILSYGNYEITKRLLEYQSLHFKKVRINKKIKLKAVVNKIEDEFTKSSQWQKLTEVRIFKSLESISTFVHIYGNKISILTLEKEIIGIIIDNEEIANMHRFFFDMLWKQAH